MRFHPALDPAELHWVLVEETGRILPELDERLGRWTLHALRRRGVDARLHTRLSSAAHGKVLLDDGTKLAAGTLVWAAGRGSRRVTARGRPGRMERRRRARKATRAATPKTRITAVAISSAWTPPPRLGQMRQRSRRPGPRARPPTASAAAVSVRPISSREDERAGGPS